MRLRCLSVLVLAPVAGTAVAQDLPSPARLLRDLGQQRYFARLESGFHRVGAWSYFVANTDGSHRLYRTGGTSLSTGLFFEPDPTTPQVFDHLTATNGRLFFFARPGTDLRQLWVSDGSSAGTRQVQIANSQGIGDIEWTAALGDRIVFQAELEGVVGRVVWISDGTTAGTTRLLTPNSNQLSGGPPSGLRVVAPGVGGGPPRLWFQQTVLTAPTTVETWFYSTDGTPVGTVLEATVPGLQNVQHPAAAILGPGRLAFASSAFGAGLDFWVLEQGQGLTRFRPAAGLSLGGAALAFDGRAWFRSAFRPDVAAVVLDEATGQVVEVPLQGGTKQGTSVLLSAEGGELLIGYQQSQAQWRMARVAPGTTVAVDAGPLPGAPTEVSSDRRGAALRLGNTLVYAEQQAPGARVWAVDVSGGQTGASATLFAGDRRGVLQQHFGRVLFGEDDPAGQVVNATDGTLAGTLQLLQLDGALLPVSSHPRLYTPFGERLAFMASAEDRSEKLVVTDGTEAGTVPVASFPQQIQFGAVRELVRVGSELWTLRPDSGGGSVNAMKVEASDGRLGTPRFVASLTFGGSKLTPFGGSALLDGHTVTGRGVYRLDPDGSLVRCLPLANDGAVEHIVPLGEQAVVITAAPRVAWLIDGSASGRRRLVTPPSNVQQTSSVVRFRDSLWLSAADGVMRIDESGGVAIPWFPAGTQLRAAGDTLFGIFRNGLWATDGTESGTRRLVDRSVLRYLDRRSPAEFHGRLLFERDAQPWISDGTPAGTVRLADVSLGVSEFWVVDERRAFFLARNQVTDLMDLWMTDGTPAGTRRLQDTPNGPGNPSLAEGGFAHGGLLYLVLEDPVVGGEPFVVDPRFSTEYRGAPCAGGGFGTATLQVSGSPRLGEFLAVRTATAGAPVGWFLLGSVLDVPRAVAGGRCETSLDLNFAVVIRAMASGGELRVGLSVPPVPALVDLRFGMQALAATGRGPLGLDVTPTAVLEIGR